MKLSEAIKAYRKRHRMSLRQFADKCDGITNGYVSMLENEVNPATGKKPIPSIEKLNALARGMDTTFEQLVRDCDDLRPVDTFADRLCTLQALKSCDNKFLADELEVDEEIIDRMRNGDYSPNLEEIDALAAALDCSREDLIGGEGSQADREDEEMWQLREEMRRTPELRTLFDAARSARPEDLRRAISIIEALKKESGNV